MPCLVFLPDGKLLFYCWQCTDAVLFGIGTIPGVRISDVRGLVVCTHCSTFWEFFGHTGLREECKS